MSICGGSTLGKALYQVLCIQKFFDFLKVKLFTGKNSLHLVGNMKFLIVGDVEHLFTYMLAICISCLETCLVKSFGRFKIRLHFYLYFFCYWFVGIWVLTPYKYMVCNYFLSFQRLPFQNIWEVESNEDGNLTVVKILILAFLKQYKIDFKTNLKLC